MAGELRAWGPVGEDCGRFIAAPEETIIGNWSGRNKL